MKTLIFLLLLALTACGGSSDKKTTTVEEIQTQEITTEVIVEPINTQPTVIPLDEKIGVKFGYRPIEKMVSIMTMDITLKNIKFDVYKTNLQGIRELKMEQIEFYTTGSFTLLDIVSGETVDLTINGITYTYYKE